MACSRPGSPSLFPSATINTRLSDCSAVRSLNPFISSLLATYTIHTYAQKEKNKAGRRRACLEFEGETHGSLLAPDLAIAVQIRELPSSSSPKILALGLSIVVQIKEHVSSSQSSRPWIGHCGTNQGLCLIYLKISPSVRPLRYKPRCMFNLHQNFVLCLAIVVQVNECITSIPNFCSWFGHRGTSQGACMFLLHVAYVSS